MNVPAADLNGRAAAPDARASEALSGGAAGPDARAPEALSGRAAGCPTRALRQALRSQL
jgi:hypothetical protein